MNNPKVSVIMSVYNDEKYLAEAIESIIRQTYKNFEFIIINDGSDDNSLNIIKTYQKKDTRIILIDQKNIGLTKSLNKAIKLAKGKYIARMDSDDISDIKRLEKQVNFLNLHQDYALVGTNIIKIDEDAKELEINQTKYTYEEIKKTFKIRNCIAHGSVMLNKELLKDKFFYDEDFLYAQDFRLWAKIAKNYKMLNLKEPLYKLRLHDLSISKKKVEQQSIYASIVAYEFEYDKTINDIDNEVIKNKKLRNKIGFILLMNFQPNLAIKYFDIFSIYFYIAFILKYIDIKQFKNLIKRFR